ncbi:hypothetical protein ABIE54_000247 [Chitinophagaceae bacterium OAS944]
MFEWPANKKLYVGGLKSDAAKTYLLANKKTLTTRRLNENDIEIDLPAQMPDTMATVIVLELKGALKTDSVRVLASNVPQQRLLAFDAQLHGKGFSYGDGKTDKYYVQNWKTNDQWLSWTFRTTQPVSFTVNMKYLAGEGNGGTFVLQTGTYSKEVKITGSGSVTKVLNEDLGTLTLPAGTHELTIKPVSIDKGELMKLLELQLTQRK